MQNGEKVLLVPGISNTKFKRSRPHRNRVATVLKEAITEEVTVIRLDDGTGNSKVRDSRGVEFFCNTDDLSRIE
ncbi:hypothetical protein HDF25_003162 [Pedobacter cryoconitis]|uniref:Uncharacterized protein n=1 Tax=Pedobacter cryoconitis TaxID=188932 RepID=A0A7X0J4I3_9SPHI|nr:hypothetical protein [Pedobacter cryoconitis]